MIKQFDRHFSKSVKNVFKLTSSSLSASLMSFFGMIFLVKLYQIEDIGHLAFVTALSQFAPIFFTLRLELAIMNVNSDKDVSLIFMSAVGFLLVSSVFTLLTGLGLIAYDVFPDVYVNNAILIWSIFFIVSINNLLVKVLNRYRKYYHIAAQVFFYTFVLYISQIILGYRSDGHNGLKNLLLGMLIANFASFLILNYGVITAKLSLIRSCNLGLLFSTLNRHKSFPLFNAPHSFVSKLSSEAPVLTLMTFFGSEIVGFFSLARRVLSQPIYILGKNIGLIFHERAGNSIRNEVSSTSHLVNKTILFMSLIIIPFSFFLFLFVEDIFSLFFGAEWLYAGTLSKLMLPLMIMRFITAPIEYIFLVTNNSMQLLIIHLAKTFFAIAGLVIGVFFDSVFLAIFLYSILSCIVYGFSIMKAQKFSRTQQMLT